MFMSGWRKDILLVYFLLCSVLVAYSDMVSSHLLRNLKKVRLTCIPGGGNLFLFSYTLHSFILSMIIIQAKCTI